MDVSKDFRNGGSKGNVSMKWTRTLRLLTVAMISVSQTNCGLLPIKSKNETKPIRVQSVKEGQPVSFNAVCVDPDTYKMLYREATREK